MSKLLTVTEYARHRGCDEKAVRKAIAEARITRLSEERRCIDPQVADFQWERNTRARVSNRPAPAGPDRQPTVQPGLLDAAPKPDDSSTSTSSDAAGQAAAPTDPTYADSRARRERADAERAELATAKMAGRLVERERVEDAVFEAFRGLRDRILAMPSLAAPAVVGLTDVREIELLMSDELRRAFEGFETTTVAKINARTAPQAQ